MWRCPSVPIPARCGRATQKRPPAIFLGCNIFEDGAAAESTIIFALVPPPPPPVEVSKC